MGLSFYFKGGREYCIFQCKNTKIEEKKDIQDTYQIYLGRPVSKENLIFFNRKDSLFQFDINSLQKRDFKGVLQNKNIVNYNQATRIWNNHRDILLQYKSASPKIDVHEGDNIEDAIRKTEGYRASLLCEKQCYYCVSFGATFFIKQLICGIEYDISVIRKLDVYTSIHTDIIMLLVIYRLGYRGSYNKISVWNGNDVASLLFSSIVISSQRISEYLAKLGSQSLKLNFLHLHINFIKNIYHILKLRIHIDSTHFDNKCFLYVSRYYKHNTDKHNGFRLLVAVHIPTGLPLYYEIISGNIIDSTMLEPTIENLKHLGCQVEHFSGDASFGNISSIERLIFLDNLASFTTRLNSNYTIFKDIIDRESANLLLKDCESFKRRNRIIRSRKTSINITDPNDATNTKKVFVYIFLDEDTRSKKLSI